MANIKSINGNPIVVPTAGIEDGAVTDAKLAQTGGILSHAPRLYGTVTSTQLADLDSAAPNAIYKVGNYTSIANMPVNATGTLLCFGSSEDNKGQTQVYVTNGGDVYIRMRWSTWSAWKKVNTLLAEKVISYINAVGSWNLPDFDGAQPMAVYKVGSYSGIAHIPVAANGTLLCFGTSDDDRGQAQIYATQSAGVYARVKWISWGTWYRIDNRTAPDVGVVMPSVVNVVTGTQYDFEFYNVCKCRNIEDYYVTSSPSTSAVDNIGTALRVNIGSVGTTSASISMDDGAGNTGSKSFTLNAVSDATVPSIKAMFIGDSLTRQGYYLAELKRMMGNALTLYGTRSTTCADSEDNDVTVLHEGRSGWGLANYVGNATYRDIANPFYDTDTGSFSFSYYMENNVGFADVTDVFILSGPNDGNSSSYITNLQAITDSIKYYNSDIRVHVMMPIPNANSGYGWGTRNYTYWMLHKDYMWKHCKEIVDTYDGVSGYFVVPTHAVVNCIYDFPTTSVSVNSRNPETITVINENVHPNKYGYYRMSDIIYAEIIANC